MQSAARWMALFLGLVPGVLIAFFALLHTVSVLSGGAKWGDLPLLAGSAAFLVCGLLGSAGAILSQTRPTLGGIFLFLAGGLTLPFTGIDWLVFPVVFALAGIFAFSTKEGLAKPVSITLKLVGILGLLAAIVFPSTLFVASRRVFHGWGCRQNLEVVGMSLAMYVDDSYGYLPYAETWAQDLMAYEGMKQPAAILKCPADDSDAFSSYGMNAALSGVKLDRVANPERTVLLYESENPGLSPHGGREDIADPPRHRDSNYYIFADFHRDALADPPSFEVRLKEAAVKP